MSKTLSYVRRIDLEGSDSNLFIIDLKGTLYTRLINVYRSFSPQNGISQREKFKYQLSLIKKALCYKNGILLEDFNLNFTKKNDINYTYVKYFDEFDDILGDNNLVQLIEFPAWSRIINNVLSESIIDHIYVKDPTLVGGVHSIKPIFGDHLLISLTLRLEKDVNEHSIRRDWRKYSKEVLLSKLAIIE